MGKKRAIPLFRHAEFQAEYPLSKELPYWDFFSDRSPACAVLSDGSLVQGLRLSGLAIETWDETQINGLTSSVRSFLNALPDGSELQFFFDVNSDYSHVVAEHERLQGGDPLISWVSEGRIASLKQSIASEALQRSSLYLFVYLRISGTKSKIASFFSKPKLFEQARVEEFEKRAAELAQHCLSIQGSLRSVGVESKDLSSGETLSLIYQTLNPKRQKTEPKPTLQTAHRHQEFVRQELA